MKHLLSLLLLACCASTATAQYRGGNGKGNTATLVPLTPLGINSPYSGGANDGASAITTSLLSLAGTGHYTGGQGDGWHAQLGSNLFLAVPGMYAGGANDGVHVVTAPALALTSTGMYTGGANDGFNSITSPLLSLGASATGYSGGTNDGAGIITANALLMAVPGMYAGGSNDGAHVISAPALTLSMTAGNMYTGGSNDGHAYVQATLSIALAVIWREFTVIKQDKDAQLYWKVGNENGTEGYEVERSYDGLVYNKCGTAAANGGVFTDAEYRYTDADPVAQCTGSSCDRVFYRIKQISFDNKFSLSQIRQVVFDVSAISVTVYPNPATDKISIRWNMPMAKDVNYDVALYSSTGALVVMEKGLNGLTSETDVSQLPAGSYYMRITTSNKTYIQEVTIIH